MRRVRERTAQTRVLLLVIACLSIQSMSLADPLHEIANGVFQHEDSGWLFPNEIDGFIRVGVPQTIDGTSDVNAYYEQVVNGARTLVSVDVYPPESPALDATFASSKAAAELKLTSGTRTPTQSETVFRVGKERPIDGSKVIYGIRSDASVSQSSLYFIDTGKWIVRIRADILESDTPEKLDKFVREQQWQSLGL